MKSRRAFLKILSFLAAMVIPWTVLPQQWRQVMSYPTGRPPVKLAVAQADEDGPSVKILQAKAFEDIEALSHPDMEGRRSGTAGETRALVYLTDQFEALKLQPFGIDRYLQRFAIPLMEERIINGRALFRPAARSDLSLSSANLLAGIKGKNQAYSIIVSAHYDHLGIYRDKLCPGANDNASGVSCILEVMRRLVKESLAGTQPRINVAAVFWGAEEMGYLGSKYFVKNPTIPLSSLQAVINFDTVAWGKEKDFILWSQGPDSLSKIIMEEGRNNGAKVELAAPNGHGSDERSFQDSGIPAVTVLSRDWLRKNHTPEDDLTIINRDKLETACAILYDTIKKLAY